MIVYRWNLLKGNSSLFACCFQKVKLTIHDEHLHDDVFEYNYQNAFRCHLFYVGLCHTRAILHKRTNTEYNGVKWRHHANVLLMCASLKLLFFNLKQEKQENKKQEKQENKKKQKREKREKAPSWICCCNKSHEMIEEFTWKRNTE